MKPTNPPPSAPINPKSKIPNLKSLLALACAALLAAPAARATAGTCLVVDLSGGPTAASYPVSYLSDVSAGGWTDEYKTTKLVLCKIPAVTCKRRCRTRRRGDAEKSVASR